VGGDGLRTHPAAATDAREETHIGGLMVAQPESALRRLDWDQRLNGLGRLWEGRRQRGGGQSGATALGVCSGPLQTHESSGGVGRGEWFPSWRERLTSAGRGGIKGGDGCLWQNCREQAAGQVLAGTRRSRGGDCGWRASKQRRHPAAARGDRTGVANHLGTRGGGSTRPRGVGDADSRL